MLSHDCPVHATRPNTSHQSQQTHRLVTAPVQAIAHVAPQSSRFPSHRHSQRTHGTITRMDASHSQIQSQPPSRNNTQFMSRPSTSTFNAPCQRTFAALPPVFENGPLGAPMTQRTSGQRGATTMQRVTHSELMMPPPSHINSMARRHPGQYNHSTLESRSCNQFENSSGMHQNIVRGPPVYGAVGSRGQQVLQCNEYIEEVDGDFVDGFEDNLVYDQSNDGVDDYGDYY